MKKKEEEIQNVHSAALGETTSVDIDKKRKRSGNTIRKTSIEMILCMCVSVQM